MMRAPAVLGGYPSFDDLVQVARPTLPAYDTAMKEKVRELIESGALTKGKHLQEFEERVALHLGVRNAVAVSSCTLGLLLAYDGLALNGEVIVPSFTFMATVHPLVKTGSEPVFVDIDPGTWCIDPARVESAISKRTTGIVAVHNFGNPAAVAELVDIANRRGLKLVFDAAHAFGSLYRGQAVGSFGDAEVFSLSPTKLLVAGEGGIVATNDDDLARHVRLGREYGNRGDYTTEFPGLSARLPEFNAMLGLGSLAELENNVRRRNELALLCRGLLDMPGVTFQSIHPEDRSSYKDLSVLISEREFGLSRDELATALRAENIDTRKYHYPPIHVHDPYRLAATPDGLPVTQAIAQRILTLPLWSHMDYETVERICYSIERIHHKAAEVRESLRGPVIRLDVDRLALKGVDHARH